MKLVLRRGGTEEREFRDAAPMIWIPREPGIRPRVPPPGEESDLLIRGVELLELLHCQLHGNERSALRTKARRLYRHVVPVEQGLLEQGLVPLLPALGICAGVGVEGQADGTRCLRMQGQHDEE